MIKMRVLSDFLEISVIWDDQTPYGSPLSGRLQETVRRRLYPVAADQLMEQMTRAPNERKPFPARELADLIRRERGGSNHRAIVDDANFWHPDPKQVRPFAAIIRSSSSSAVLEVPLTPETITSLRLAMQTGEADIPGLKLLFEETYRNIAESGLKRAQLGVDLFPASPVFVGHACVTWTDGNIRLWSDPFLRPKNLRFPLHYQPITPCDAPETQHAILITHSHPDHFSPGSLFMFPANTPIIVPKVASENLLSIDLVYRLTQLGFNDVRPLDWGQTVQLGSFDVTAVPFHGEQPLGGGAHPDRDDRMVGNGYKVASAKGPSAVILADSGSDPWASAQEAARRIRDLCGQVDIVFANHRRWRVYPPQYLTTSVPEYLCFIPDLELALPQQIMYAPEDLWAVAETLGARYAIPYAMGGAAWFEEIGLGGDNLNPHGGTAFEGGSLDLGDFSDPDTLAVPGVAFVNALPGQGIDSYGQLLWPIHMHQPTLDEIKLPRIAATTTPRALAVGGPFLSPQLISDLFELSQLDPKAWFVAMPGYCELISGEGEASKFLWAMVDRLSFNGVWRLLGDRPLCAGLFRSPSDWCDAFEILHRHAFLALRDGEDPIEELHNLVYRWSEQEVPTTVVAVICKELLGIELDADSLILLDGTSKSMPIVSKIQSEPVLPPQADILVRQWGKNTVACSLLLVKTLHNIFITAQQAERKGIPPSEAAFFARVFK